MITIEHLRKYLEPDDGAALDAVVKIYGNDTNVLMNALTVMLVRVAIVSDTEPTSLFHGLEHHWNYQASAFNQAVAEATEARH